jgi:predicted metal-dependent HD superfamily phosphohydrolase
MAQATASSLSSTLHARFAAFALSLGASSKQAETWSTNFVKRYTEPQRHYHTVAHIAAMLKCLDERKAKVTDPVAVELAVFFHDWIYEPRGTANEAESVVVFRSFAKELGIEKSLRGKVVRMIEATIKHELSQNSIAQEKEDLELFLDFDLEVLGRDWEAYMVYAKQIRMEYLCFEDPEYKMGRAKVLKTFLGRDRVYFSESFHTERESAARQNMQREIEKLEAGAA